LILYSSKNCNLEDVCLISKTPQMAYISATTQVSIFYVGMKNQSREADLYNEQEKINV